MKFQANGKLLLTGEYLVLSGATALAVTLQFGQQMMVAERTDRILYWESFSPEGRWFDASFSLPTLDLIKTSDNYTARILKKWLGAIRQLRTDFLQACIEKPYLVLLPWKKTGYLPRDSCFPQKSRCA